MTRIPKGCDQQGRYPEAAEPCTELGVDDEPDFYGREHWRVFAVDLVLACLVAACAVALVVVIAGRVA